MLNPGKLIPILLWFLVGVPVHAQAPLPHAPALVPGQPWSLDVDLLQFGLVVGGMKIQMDVTELDGWVLRTEIRDWVQTVPGMQAGESIGAGRARISPQGLESLSVVSSNSGANNFDGEARDGLMWFSDHDDPRVVYDAQHIPALERAMDSYSVMGHVFTQTPYGQCPESRHFVYPTSLVHLRVEGHDSGTRCTFHLEQVVHTRGYVREPVRFVMKMGDIDGAWVPVSGLLWRSDLVFGLRIRPSRQEMR